MGQQVVVVERPSRRAGIVRYEANRCLTGQGHERFTSPAEAVGPRPAAELARRLFATGRVDSVHMFSNMITVDLHEGSDAGGLDTVIEDLYQYWRPGVEPPAFEDLVPADEPAPATGEVAAASDTALSEAAKRVPAHLLERSRAARERWKSKGG